MQKTANQIKSSFELLASGHYQIHSFLYAQEFEQQAYENLIYPLMLVYPLGGNLSGTTYSRNYRVIIADRVLKSEGNELEVESDTQLIALDVLAYWMKLGQNERFTITSSNTITPFWEKWGDEVTGHFVDIGIEEFYDFNSCAIPLSGSIPTPINPCKDARISVNSVVYGNAPSDSNFNVVVKDQDGALVGSLIGSEWVVNTTGGTCPDSSYTIEDTLGNILYTGSIVSGGSLTQAIGNSTLNINDSAGTLISSESILAEGTDSYNVADSVAVIKDSAGTTLKSENILATASENISISDSIAVIKDSANLTLKSENILAEATENITINDSLVNVRKSDNVLISAVSVKAENTENYLVGDSNVTNSNSSYDVDVKATDSLTLPDQQINVNSVDEGDIPSVGTIDIDLSDGVNPVAPTSVTITGRTIDIVVPSDGGSYDLDLVDRYGNAFPTKQVTANATWDLRTLTPFDWADLYLSRLTNPPSGAQETAVIDFFDDMVAAGIFQGSQKIELDIGGNAADHAWNARYPFDNNSSMKSEYIGSPTHNANGVNLNGTSQAVRTNAYVRYLDDFNKQISIYTRNNILNPSGGIIFNAGNGYTAQGFGITQDSRNRYATEGLSIAPNLTNALGLTSLSRESSTIIRYRQNSINLSGSPSTGVATYNKVSEEITIGALMSKALVFSNYKQLNYCYFRVGNALTDSQELDHYNIVQALQTALSRQV